MRLLLFSDNHFSKSSSIITASGSRYSVRLENQIQSLDWVESTAVKNNCDMIVCLGDFFDSPTLCAEEISALKELQFSSIPRIFLVGNHELGLVIDKYNSANIFSIIDVASVIAKPTTMLVNRTLICFLPYIKEDNRKKLEEYLATQVDPNSYDYVIILSHNDIKGINYGGHISKFGFSIDEIEGCCNLFINGHLHNCGYINDRKTILNIGNLTGQNFLEDAFTYSHNVLILDTDSLEVVSIENPYALNFYNLDLCEKDNEEINSILSKLKTNAVLSIRCDESNIYSVKDAVSLYKSNGSSIVASRVILCARNNAGSVDGKKADSYMLNHVSEFIKYIHENVGNDDTINEELQMVLS